MKNFYYCIVSDRQTPPSVMLLGDTDIINFAREECGRQGISLESCADIATEFDEDGDASYEREFEIGEEFETSCSKLADDGRIFLAYPDTATGRANFLTRAAEFGLAEQAQVLIDQSVYET